jgi:hypothetical protein
MTYSSLADVYQDTLGRAPDASGMEAWTQAMNSGMSLDQISSQIQQSQEFQTRYQDMLANSAAPTAPATTTTAPTSVFTAPTTTPTNTTGGLNTSPTQPYNPYVGMKWDDLVNQAKTDYTQSPGTSRTSIDSFDPLTGGKTFIGGNEAQILFGESAQPYAPGAVYDNETHSWAYPVGSDSSWDNVVFNLHDPNYKAADGSWDWMQRLEKGADGSVVSTPYQINKRMTDFAIFIASIVTAGAASAYFGAGAAATGSSGAATLGGEALTTLPSGGMAATGSLAPVGSAGTGVLGSGLTTMGVPGISTELLGTGLAGSTTAAGVIPGLEYTLGGSIMAGSPGTLSTSTGLGSAVTNFVNTGAGLTPLVPGGTGGLPSTPPTSPTTPGAPTTPTTPTAPITPTTPTIPKVPVIPTTGGGGGTTTTGTTGGGGNLGSLLSLLYGAYSKNNISDQLKGTLDELKNMYKPGSPEAELMRKKIEARDAAAGRRSQYGPREVELAGKLADARMRTLSSPGFMNMQAAYMNNAPGSGGLSELFGSLSSGGAVSGGLGLIGSLLNQFLASGGTVEDFLSNNQSLLESSGITVDDLMGLF